VLDTLSREPFYVAYVYWRWPHRTLMADIWTSVEDLVEEPRRLSR
jgi:hypothetical protein